MKPLEWVGVRLLDLTAWLRRASDVTERVGVRLIVRARPIPLPPPLPRVEFPSDVPRIELDVEQLDPTVTDFRLGDVHPDRWTRFEGRA